ncbi:MAG: glycosyltransferase [Candidatus Ancillula sp.]|nr:glycosyltransferase [Candidatus Ancillula sp.]
MKASSAKISVIVPIYNGDKYLLRALNSILDQSIARELLQVIMIDDGSTDNSAAVARTFVSSHPYTFKLIVQENAGTAASRNRALDEVSTKYVTFLDQDDYFDKTYLAELYKVAEETDADVTACGYRRVSETGKVLYTRELNKSTWAPYIHLEAWGKLHKTEFINRINARFFANVFGEDLPFSVAENLSAKYVITDETCYNWFLNTESVSSTIHKQYSEINLNALLEKLLVFAKLPLIEYQVLTVATYGLLHSNVRATKKEFINNVECSMGFLLEKLPNLPNNKYLMNAPDGCPIMTRVAAKVMLHSFLRGKYSMLWIGYKLFIKRLLAQK